MQRRGPCCTIFCGGPWIRAQAAERRVRDPTNLVREHRVNKGFLRVFQSGRATPPLPMRRSLDDSLQPASSHPHILQGPEVLRVWGRLRLTAQGHRRWFQNLHTGMYGGWQPTIHYTLTSSLMLHMTPYMPHFCTYSIINKTSVPSRPVCVPS